jgi:hypothetical protein
MALFRREMPPIDPYIEAHLVVKETGHQREEWFKLLDEQQAFIWTTKQITTWLRKRTKLNDWWSESIGLAYVEARGLAKTSQQPTGRFTFTMKREFDVELSRLFTVLNDVQSWAVFDRPRVLTAKGGKISFAFDDKTRAHAQFVVKDGGAIVLQVQHELIPSEAGIKPRDLYWREVLSGVQRRLEV